MEKIWLVNFESCADGEILFNSVPCASFDIAKRVLRVQKEEALTEYEHYKHLTGEDIEYFDVIDEEDVFEITDKFEPFYEHYYITESKIEK